MSRARDFAGILDDDGIKQSGDVKVPTGNIFIGKEDATLGTAGTNIADTSTIISASAGNTYHVYNTSTSTYPFVVSFDGNVTSANITATRSGNGTQTTLRLVGGANGFDLKKTQQESDYAHFKPINDGSPVVLRLMPKTSDNFAYLELWNSDFEADTVNYSRGMLYYDTSNVLTIQTNANGTGVAGAIKLRTNSTDALTIDTSQNATFSQTVYSPSLGVGTTDNTVLGGTQVYIKKRDANYNLQRWGEGDVNGADSYRFRIDQNFNFIANSGSGDNFNLDSDTGNITGVGTISSVGQVLVDANGTGNTLHIWDDSTMGQPGLIVTDTGSQPTSTQTFYAKQYGTGLTTQVFGEAIGGRGIILTDGTASTGLLIGTYTNDDIIIGTNNTAALTVDGSQISTFSNNVSINSPNDQILTLNQSTTGWNYIGFSSAGSRKFYLGNDGNDGFVLGSDVAGKTFSMSNIGDVQFGGATASVGAITTNGQLNVDVASGRAAIFNAGTTNVVADFVSEDAEVWLNLMDSSSSTYGVLIGHDTNNLVKFADNSVVTQWSIAASGTVTSTGINNIQRDVRSAGQVRANGWYNASATTNYTGLAFEIGVSSGKAFALSYNRDTSSYGSMEFNANDFTFNNPVTAEGGLYIVDANTTLTEGASDSVRISTDDGYVDIGPMNTSYCHFQTDRDRFYFDKVIHADGQIYNYNGGATDQPYWGAHNDGVGSGLDADLLDGLQGSYYDHRRYTDDDTYLGGYYVSGGSEKPNDTIFGAGKLKIAMLGSANIGGASWNDVLWMSTYTGGDVKRSTAFVSSKYDNTSVWVNKVNYDSASWGTNYLFWNTGNDGSGSGLDADLLDGNQASAFVLKSGDTMTGQLTISGLAPQMKFNDTDGDDFWIHINSNRFYILPDRDDSGSWETPYAMELNSSTNVPYLFGNQAWTAGNDGSGSGLDADLLDGLHSTSFLRADANTATTGYLRAEGFTGAGGSGLRLSLPAGASYSTQTSSVTGAIKITLPVTWTNTMLRMTIKVYEYTTGESFEVVCGGYNYSATTTWINTFAYIIGDPDVDRNFNVRFGHDGSKCAIYIGETNSTWTYPQVFVTGFEAGYSNTAEDTWNDGWSIGFATSLGTITQTASSKMIGTYGNRSMTIGGALGVGTAASSTTGEIRATNNITAYYSDERLKNLEGPIDNALEKVQQLTGYYFTENEKAKELGYDNSRRQVGVSAQEVEKVLPEVVTSAPIDEDYKSVWYDKLVPLLIEAVKELKQEVDYLKTKGE